MKIVELLENEIETEINGLCMLEDGSEEKLRAISGIAQLQKLVMESEKTEAEVESIRINSENEAIKVWTEIDKTKAETESIRSGNSSTVERNIDKAARYAIDAAGIVVPVVFYNTWMKRGFKFEETGTFTSTTFRNMINKFRI